MKMDLNCMNFKIIIQARVGSTRLPGKMSMIFHDNYTLFDIIIKNLLKGFKNTDIILATSNDERNSILCEIADKYKIDFYKGSEDDVLSRFLNIANDKNLDFFIRLCGDNPFIQNESIINLIKNYNCEDYIAYFYKDETPSIKTHSGLFTELVSKKCINKINNLTLNVSNYREHVTNYIYENINEFKVKKLYIENNNIRNLRLTIDTIDDFNLCKSIYGRLNPNLNIENILINIKDIEKDRMIELIYKNKK
jgi:spore coat polysaccharide biosynthesis protein SpsF